MDFSLFKIIYFSFYCNKCGHLKYSINLLIFKFSQIEFYLTYIVLHFC